VSVFCAKQQKRGGVDAATSLRTSALASMTKWTPRLAVDVVCVNVCVVRIWNAAGLASISAQFMCTAAVNWSCLKFFHEDSCQILILQCSLHALCVEILICPSVGSSLIRLFLLDKDNAPAKSGMIHIVSKNELSFAACSCT
jgi:hypothetical protein